MDVSSLQLLFVSSLLLCCVSSQLGSFEQGKEVHLNQQSIKLPFSGVIITPKSLSGLSRAKRSSPPVPGTSAIERGSGEQVGLADTGVKKEETYSPQRYQFASVDFDHVSSPFIITLWILTAGLAKIGFQLVPKLKNLFPESCLLIIIGVLIGLVIYFTGVSSAVGSLTPNIFFLYMLPPIVLDAGYFMPNRLFFDNLVTILLYAVIGTIWNAMTIGLSLWAIGLTGLYETTLPLLHALLFSSIVSAVDPVAVLAVFEEIHVNEVLYIIVFGESLLNDAVTVVLYHMFEEYSRMGLPNILVRDYVVGVASFFVVACGGTLLGILWGFLAAFTTRFTHHVRTIEPLVVFVMAYLSYITAELFHMSGIMALTFCGITMKNYVEENVSHKSHVTVKYTMKMLASSSETIIFVLLGVATVNNKHEWNTWFVIFTVLFCLMYRALGVIILTSIVNRFRLHQLDIVEQFIMSYGGLRGAVAFALALVIDEDVIPSKNMMVTAIISVVYFTVILQGTTIGFFVKILNVPKSTKGTISMNERLHLTVIDHVMAGIEGISDHLIGNFKIRDKFRYYNNRYLRRILTNNSSIQEPKIFQTYSKLNLNDALTMAKSNIDLSSTRTVDMSTSLSSLLKTYSQANLSSLGPDELHMAPVENNLLNVDLGELSYNPSFKDLADAEVHHILEDSMFKPARKVRRYSRSEINESNGNHSPHHHYNRMASFRCVSENGRSKPRTTDVKVDSQRRVRSHKSKRNVGTINVAYTKDDDEGIAFCAKEDCTTENRQAAQHTSVEKSFPWKRNYGNRGKICPREDSPQLSEEKHHRISYLSPPAERSRIFSHPKFRSSERMPPTDTVVEVDEGDSTSSKTGANGESIPGLMRRAQSGTKKDARSMVQVHAVDFECTSPKSKISETVSEDVPSMGSPETLSIEGPDPSLCDDTPDGIDPVTDRKIA